MLDYVFLHTFNYRIYRNDKFTGRVNSIYNVLAEKLLNDVEAHDMAKYWNHYVIFIEKICYKSAPHSKYAYRPRPRSKKLMRASKLTVTTHAPMNMNERNRIDTSQVSVRIKRRNQATATVGAVNGGWKVPGQYWLSPVRPGAYVQQTVVFWCVYHKMWRWLCKRTTYRKIKGSPFTHRI